MAQETSSQQGASAAHMPDIFTLFPELPVELRLKIWKASITPQFVGIGFDDGDGYSKAGSVLLGYGPCSDSFEILQTFSQRSRELGGGAAVLMETTPWKPLHVDSLRDMIENPIQNSCKVPTALLHTSREARECAREHCALIFTDHFRHPIYFNFEIDTIWFTDWKAFEVLSTAHKTSPSRTPDDKSIRCILVEVDASVGDRSGVYDITAAIFEYDRVAGEVVFADDEEGRTCCDFWGVYTEDVYNRLGKGGFFQDLSSGHTRVSEEELEPVCKTPVIAELVRAVLKPS